MGAGWPGWLARFYFYRMVSKLVFHSVIVIEIKIMEADSYEVV